MTAFSSKDPHETDIFTHDFANILDGATIVSAVSRLTWISGVSADLNASAMLVGDPIVSGTKVGQYITGGQPGDTYHWVAEITTNDVPARVLDLGGDIPIQSV